MNTDKSIEHQENQCYAERAECRKRRLRSPKEPEIRWGYFYRQVFMLVLPLALQNLINVGVTAADVIMLGRVDEDVLAGASLAGQIQYIMVLILFGLASGATVLTAQYWGKKDEQAVERILGITVGAAVAVTALFAISAWTIPYSLMSIFTSDPVVAAYGVTYLRIVAFSYVMIGITQAYLYIMRSIERVLVATVVYFCSLVCNIILNAVLIFGLLGMPAFGIRGAAMATLCARILELLLVAVYARRMNRDIRLKWRYVLRFDKVLFGDFIKYASPVVINELIWGMGMAASAAILGHMGSEAVAANSVAQVMRQLAIVMSLGISSASAIYLGKTIGEKKMAHAKAYADRFLLLSVCMGALGGVLILAVSNPLIGGLSLSHKAASYLRVMFVMMSYYVIAQSWNTTMIVGIFRSGGDTRFGLLIDALSMWMFSILLGFIAAFLFEAAVPVVFFFLLSDELVKIPLTCMRYRRGIWLKDLTRNRDHRSIGE